MKISLIISAALVLVFTLPVAGQLSAPESPEGRIAEIVTQRETLIARNLPLTPDEREAFWPLYKKYRAERDEVDARALKLIAEFEKSLDNFTEPLARKFASESLELQRADLAVRTKYLKPFQKVLPAAKAAKFYQIESKLDATLAYYRAQRVPLIRL